MSLRLGDRKGTGDVCLLLAVCAALSVCPLLPARVVAINGARDPGEETTPPGGGAPPASSRHRMFDAKTVDAKKSLSSRFEVGEKSKAEKLLREAAHEADPRCSEVIHFDSIRRVLNAEGLTALP